jgi:hypothetical protein
MKIDEVDGDGHHHAEDQDEPDGNSLFGERRWRMKINFFRKPIANRRSIVVVVIVVVVIVIVVVVVAISGLLIAVSGHKFVERSIRRSFVALFRRALEVGVCR